MGTGCADGQEGTLGKKIGWRFCRRRDIPAWLLQRSFPPVPSHPSAHHPSKMTPSLTVWGSTYLGWLDLIRKLGMFWAVWVFGALPLEHGARRAFHQVRSCLQMFTEGHRASQGCQGSCLRTQDTEHIDNLSLP